jgi:prealbumin domain-containing protein
VTVLRKLTVGLAGATLLAGVSAITLPAAAAAAPGVQTGLGYNVTPAQPYRNNPDASDWTGSYLVNGKQVWCVKFAYQAPAGNEQYRAGQPLTTKWGTPLDPTIASEISYLLLRYGNTTSADDAAALAHLLHSWTAAPQNPGQLAPTNDYRTIAYDAAYHLSRLPASAQAAVSALQADAQANHGPWTASVSKPTGPQTIGTAGNWAVSVLNAASRGLSSVPVTVTVTDGTLSGGKTSANLTTPANGSPLVVSVTPTGPNPTVTATLASPNATPVELPAVNPVVQNVVTTGGEQQISASGGTTARNAPGSVHVLKIDANTRSPLPGASLELTGPDKSSPALDADGGKIVGSDGKPQVQTSAADGTVTFGNLQTPQNVCVVETAPPSGYDQAFNASDPPSACGAVTPGGTLSLTLTNTPNKVPVAIPAGGPPTLTAMATVLNRPDPLALAGFGGLLLLCAGLIGAAALRRRRHES